MVAAAYIGRLTPVFSGKRSASAGISCYVSPYPEGENAMPTFEYVFDDGFRTCDLVTAIRRRTIRLIEFRKRNLLTGAWVNDT